MSAIFKGWFGEKATQFGMWMGLDANVYRRGHNLVLPCQGGATQIDHVLVSVYGIFAIETKNMQGWIFGDERSPQWTQCIFGKKSWRGRSRPKAAPVATRALHVAWLRQRHGGDACPRCGAALVLRTARNGSNAGGSLFGCSGFPKCRYTRSA